MTTAGTCSADSGDAASSGSSQQPLRARLHRRQGIKRSAQHAAIGAKRKAETLAAPPAVDSPRKLGGVPDSTGCQPDGGALSPPARQSSPVQANRARVTRPGLHAQVEHAADLAHSAGSQHTPAQESPARTSHSPVTPVPEQDSCLREAPAGHAAAREGGEAPLLGTISKQSPIRDLRQRQAELQVLLCPEIGTFLRKAPACCLLKGYAISP